MAELFTRPVYFLEVHLVFASAVWLAAWLLTSLRLGSATAKYWIWVATSLNFALPVGVVVDVLWGSHVWWARPLGMVGDLGVRITSNGAFAATLGAVWLLGAALVMARLVFRIRSEHLAAARNLAEPERSFLLRGIPVLVSSERGVPAVDGLWRPHISLPRGIDRLLTERELNAVLLHELTHAARRDNLIRLVQELALSILWFHPLVWITGARMALYRELSCDESVMRGASGTDLMSALAKLAGPEEGPLLQATASSFLGRRLDGLAAGPPEKAGGAASAVLAVIFAAILLAAMFETVAHTACCFVHVK